MIVSLKILYITFLLLLNALLSVGQVVKSENESQGSIINGTDWFDVEGRPIMAHEGDIAEFDGVYYWYGSSYENNPKGKFDIADGPVWNGVQVYRSTDLIILPTTFSLITGLWSVFSIINGGTAVISG